MTITTKRGDRTTWEWSLLQAGSAVDLSTGVSDVVIYMRKRPADSNKIDGASVTYTAGGACSYTPTESDVNTTGTFDFMTVVQWSDGTHSKFPSEGYDLVTINDALDE